MFLSFSLVLSFVSKKRPHFFIQKKFSNSGHGRRHRRLLRPRLRRRRPSGAQVLEHSLPLGGGLGPRQVLRDAPVAHRFVRRRPVRRRGPRERRRERVDVFGHEPIGVDLADVVSRRALLDGVNEPSDRGDDGHRAARHGVELHEAARLLPRADDEKVASRGDERGQRRRERDGPGGDAGEPVAQRLHHRLEVLLSRAQDGNLDLFTGACDALDEPGDRSEEHVDALLLLEAADEAEEGGVGVDGQAQLCLEGLFRDGLALGDGRGVELEREQRGGGRRRGVAAVDDALDADGAEDVVELDAAGGVGADLFCVVLRDGNDLISGLLRCF